MDMQLVGQVLWRHRRVVAAGLGLAIVLAAFSMVRIGGSGLSYRQDQQWATTSKILVTQAGFPEGRVVSTDTVDGSRFTSLADLYASFVDTDPVKQLILAQGAKIKGKVAAATITSDGNSNEQLPIIGITGIAATANDSILVTRRATNALLQYIQQQQNDANIAPKNRVMVQLIQSPGKTKMVRGRPMTLPIIVFLGVMSLALGLVFVLENLARSRRGAVDGLSTPMQRVERGEIPRRDEISTRKRHAEGVALQQRRRSRRAP